MTSEMWSFAPDGSLYHEKAIAFLRALFQRWAELGVSHSLTLVLFSRSYAPKRAGGGSAPQVNPNPNTHPYPNPNPDPNPDLDPEPQP